MIVPALTLGFKSKGPPAAPSGLATGSVTDDSIDLSWTDNSSDETAFEVWMSTPDNTNFNLFSTVGAGSTGTNAGGLDPETPYYFKVRAERSGVYSDFSNEVSETTLAPSP